MREKLIEFLNNIGMIHEREAETVADYLITNDVIKVIRCKNCANYFPRGEYDGVKYGDCYYDNIVHPDDYCSMAELRGDSDG